LPGVLVVEDEILVRSFLAEALRPMARVLQAQDGEQAVEILHTIGGTAIDLVIVDYVLPGCSGLDVLRLTKRLLPTMPVVMITGFSTEELAVQTFRAGASDYLKKPVDLDHLTHTVTTLLSIRRQGMPTTITGHPNIKKALAYICERFAEDITLQEVAREAGLSRYHFCRLFHRETGMRFLAYVHALRIRRAEALLADRYLRISDVAYTVGFSDLSSFDRTFRRVVGRSPREYRASLKSA
jgi:two-component system response regulator YesN